MKYTLLLLVAVAALIVACNKDKFTTEPQIKIKKVSPSDVFKGDIIEIEGEFTDDEGDIDSAFIVYKFHTQTGTTTKTDTIDDYTITSVNLPEKTREGEIFISFSYGEIIDGFILLPNTPVNKDTLASFGLILKDKAGHRSNYSESEKIWLKKP